jgi:hypothetical protein
MTTDVAVRVLAVIGGGAGGGLALGLLAQLLLRALSIRNSPRWSLGTIRLLGGVICGWLVALWLFGGGGPGIGGSGGFSLGSGSGSGETPKKGPKSENENSGKSGDESKTPDEQTLRIEVLGANALKNADKDASHCYRLDKQEGAHYLSFAEVKDEILHRQQQQPPLRLIQIVLYKDSPDDNRPVVSQVKNWSRERNLEVVVTTKSTTDAPR